jgi:hypothetical protein
MSERVIRKFLPEIEEQLADDPNQLELNEKAEIKTRAENRKKKKPGKTPILIKLDNDLLDYITEQAQRDRVPRTSYIKKLILEDMKKGRK